MSPMKLAKQKSLRRQQQILKENEQQRAADKFWAQSDFVQENSGNYQIFFTICNKLHFFIFSFLQLLPQ